MSLELSTLAFKVETGQLKAAAEEIANLGEKLKGLNTAISASTLAGKDSVKAAQDTAKITAAEAKATAANLKVEEQKAKTDKANLLLEQQKAKGVKETTQATNESTEANTRHKASIYEMDKATNAFMLQGKSFGESRRLAAAQLQGETTANMKLLAEELTLRRSLQGSNPFDNSLSGIEKLKIQYRELLEGMRQYNADSGLSIKQTQELSRDKQRLFASLQKEGASLGQIKAAMRALNDETVREATLVNNRIGTLKEQQRLDRESANAKRAVLKEEEKMLSMVTSLTSAENAHLSITEKSAEAQARYARNLKLAGVSGEEATRKLKAHADQQKIIDAVEQKRQAMYLQRGLQPQIGDVAVSLAAGQNPLTVLLQQGDQIRGLIAQTGVQGELLRKTMANAMTETVKSIGQTATAMGSVLGGAVTSLGKAVMTVAIGPFKLMNNSLDTMGMSAHVAAFRLQQVKDAWALLGKVGIAAVIAGLATLSYQMYQSVKVQDELTRALSLNGASMGLTKQDALDLALSMEGMGVTTRNAAAAMQVMAKEGGFAKSEIVGVTQAAVDLYKYGGVAIEDTVKAYAKLKEDPLKGLIELAKATGQVNIRTLEQVEGLIKVGDKTTAVSEAFKAMQEANSKSVTRMKDELSGLATALIAVGEWFAKVMDGMFSLLFNKLSPTTKLAQEIVALQADVDRSQKDKDTKSGRWDGLDKNDMVRADTDLKRRQDLVIQLTAKYNEMNKAAMGESADQQNGIKLAKAFEKSTALREEFLKTDRLAQKKVDTEKSYGSRISAETDTTKRKALEKERDAILAEIEKQRKSATKPEGKTEAQRQLELDVEIVKDLKNATKDLNAEWNNKEDALNRQLALGKEKGGIDKAEYAILYKQLKEIQPAHIKQLAEEKAYTEGLNKANEERAKNLQKIQEYNNGTRDENLRLDYRLEVLGKTEEQVKALNRERDKELKLAKARDDYDKQIIENKKVSSRPNEANRDALKAYEDRVKAINRESAVYAAEETYKAFNDIMNPIADGIANALMVGGEEGANMIRKQIEDALLREPFQLIVNALIKDVLGTNGGNNLEGALEKIGTKITTAYAQFSKLGESQWLTSIGTAAATQVGKAGTYLFEKGFEKTGEYLMKAGTSIGKYAGVIDKVGQGLSYLNSALLASEGKWGAAIGSAIGNAFGGPIGSFIGEKIGGFVDGLFGGGTTYLSHMGMSGQFSSTGFAGSNYTVNREEPNKWESWFGASGKDVKSTQAMPKAVKDQLSMQYLGTLASASVMGQGLGMNMSWLKDFKQNVDIITLDAAQAERYNNNKAILANSGSSFEQKQKAEAEIADIDKTVKAKYDAVFDSIRNKIATTVIPKDFIRQGEQAQDAFVRLSSALGNVNTVLSNLGYTLYDLTINGANAASNLQEAFGGSEAFGTAMGQYYTGYYTDAERQGNALSEVSKLLGTLGINKSVNDLSTLGVEGMRKLVEGFRTGIGSPEGDAKFAAIVSIANQFRPLADSAESLRKTFDDLTTSIETEIARIRGDIAGTGVEGQASAQMAFTLATAQARAGDQEAAASLPALSQNLLEMAANNASTLQELNAIRAATASSLSATAAIVKSFGITPAVVSTAGVAGIVNAAPVANTINTQAYNTSSSSNTEVLVALEAVASMTNKNYKLLDGVINGENNMRVEVIV